MANERTYPLLPCAQLDESIAFYESLGFKKTYRQVRPNPYAVVALEDIQIHLFGIEGFNPAESYGSVIVAVPDPDNLYHDFAAGLRKRYGKLPVTGIPRILRPRKKYGTVRGFSVVDPGGNWLRIYKLGESEEADSAETAEGLTQIMYVAARLGDAHGDEALALKTLESGLTRFGKTAGALELARAHLYRAELAVRTKDHELAQVSLTAAKSLEMTDDERAALADEFAHVTELVTQE
ncbi:MAG TPA: VOC family protein [Candidatus Binatia bacterium]|nr:VOC family protein [Candidatus Binatia bacterium]